MSPLPKLDTNSRLLRRFPSGPGIVLHDYTVTTRELEDQRITTPPAQQNTLLTAHLGVLLGAVPVALTAVNLVARSKGDPAVLSALISYSTPTAVLLGTITQMLPIALVYGGVYLFGLPRANRADWAKDPRVPRLIAAAWGAVALVSTFNQSWSNLIIAVAAIAVLSGLSRWIARSDRASGRTPSAPIEPIAVIVVALMTFANGTTGWGTTERIELRDGSVFVATVLRDDPNPVVSIGRNGGLIYTDESDIKTRTACNRAAAKGPAFNFDDVTMTPKCPARDSRRAS